MRRASEACRTYISTWADVLETKDRSRTAPSIYPTRNNVPTTLSDHRATRSFDNTVTVAYKVCLSNRPKVNPRWSAWPRAGDGPTHVCFPSMTVLSVKIFSIYFDPSNQFDFAAFGRSPRQAGARAENARGHFPARWPGRLPDRERLLGAILHRARHPGEWRLPPSSPVTEFPPKRRTTRDCSVSLMHNASSFPA